MLHAPQRAQQQAGAGEQHECERDFGGDQHLACAVARAGRAFPAAFPQGVDDGGPRGLQRRHDPGEQRGHDGDRQREQHHPAVDGDRIRPRNAVATYPDEQPRRPISEHQPERAADRREHERLGDDLADEDGAIGAERRPDRQLLAPRGGSPEHQVAEVGAGDQQHEADRCEQDHERTLDVAHELTVERNDVDAEALIGRVGLFEAGGDPGHLGLGLFHRDPGLQPADHRQPEPTAGVARPLVGRQRFPELRFGRHLQGPRHDADDFEGAAVEGHRLAEHVAGAAEAPLPQAVGNQHHAVVARRLVRLRIEAPDQRANAHHVEEVRRGLGALQPFRFLGAGEIEGRAAEAGHGRKGRALIPPVAVVRPRRDVFLDALLAVVHPHHRDAIGFRVRKRPQQHAVEDAEHRRVDPDAQREGQGRDRREGGGAEKSANRVAAVTDEGRGGHGD